MSTNRNLSLVSTDWLAQNLGKTGVRVFDLRATGVPGKTPDSPNVACTKEYEEAHIPGALFVDWLHDIVDKNSPIKMAALTLKEFESFLSERGVLNSDHIIIYDKDGGDTASRLWWLLKYYGHEKVSLLDGGWPKWEAEGHPRSPEVQTFPKSHYKGNIVEKWNKTQEEIRRVLNDPNTSLIDVRGAVLFTGEETRGIKKGRIPGAFNLPRAGLVHSDHQLWKNNDELKSVFEEANIDLNKSLITYCNSGVAASAMLFALHIMDHPSAAAYGASWYDWESDDLNPIEVG